MAGGQSKGRMGKSARGKRSSGASAERRPSEYAREAVSEWGKAARLTGATLSPLAKRAVKRLVPSKSEKGGRIGDAADAVLSKMGKPGKVASKVGVGSRLIEKALPSGNGASANGSGTNGNGSGGNLPVPIQESIEVAVPIRTAYALATSFDRYADFLEHVEAVESGDATGAAFDVKLHGSHRTIEIEILDSEEGRRVEWCGTEGQEHSGVVSFHELAPNLTHLELSVEIEPKGMVQRLTRTAHLTERAIRSELHRFKAYAELWQDEEDVVEDEEVAVDEEPAAEEDLEQKPQADQEVAEDEEDEDHEAGEEDGEPVEAYEEEEGFDEEDEEDYDYEEAYEDEEPVEASEEEEAYDERPPSIEAYPDVEPAPTR